MKHKLSLAQEALGPISLLTVGALYGVSAVIAKHLSGSINAYQVVEYRFGIAFISAVVLMIVLRQKIAIKDLNKPVLALFALTFPASAILFTFSIFYGTVALAVFTFYAANLATQFVIGQMYFDEKIDRFKVLAFALTILALVIFTNPFSGFSLTPGLVFGVIAGVLQGVASAFQKLLSNVGSKSSLLALQAFAGFIMAFIILLVTGGSVTPALSGFDWLVTTLFGLSMLAIMHLFLVGYKYTNLGVGSILVSSELLFGPLFAYFLISELLSTSVLIGGVITAIAAVLANIQLIRSTISLS